MHSLTIRAVQYISLKGLSHLKITLRLYQLYDAQNSSPYGLSFQELTVHHLIDLFISLAQLLSPHHFYVLCEDRVLSERYLELLVVG